MRDATQLWHHTLDRFADLLDRIETAIELGDWEAPALAERIATAPMPSLPDDPELRRRAAALQAEGERLALELGRRRDEIADALSNGPERRTAARTYRRTDRLPV
jgi:hypothetical protein